MINSATVPDNVEDWWDDPELRWDEERAAAKHGLMVSTFNKQRSLGKIKLTVFKQGRCNFFYGPEVTASARKRVKIVRANQTYSE